MFPGINPRDMQKVMKQMGIKQDEIPATEVIIRTADKEIVITDPSVTKINMKGEVSFQISGDVHERSKSVDVEVTDDDVDTVVEQTGVDKALAKKMLIENNGDLAKTIMNLTLK